MEYVQGIQASAGTTASAMESNVFSITMKSPRGNEGTECGNRTH